MKNKQKEPWQIAAARYCVGHSEKGFIYEDLREFVSSNYTVNDGHISQFFEEELQSPSGRQHSRMGRAGTWIPPLELVSKVTDYDELKHARQSAESAWRMAILALIVSGVGSLFQMLQYFLPLK